MATENLGLANPKDAFGILKVPNLSVVPAVSLIYEALGMWNGAMKYGHYNWRGHPVVASIYVDAALRHIMAWQSGEEIDPQSGAPHLGHAKACLGILADALETGNLIDDRPKSDAVTRLLRQYDRTPKQTEAKMPHPVSECGPCQTEKAFRSPSPYDPASFKR